MAPDFMKKALIMDRQAQMVNCSILESTPYN